MLKHLTDELKTIAVSIHSPTGEKSRAERITEEVQAKSAGIDVAKLIAVTQQLANDPSYQQVEMLAIRAVNGYEGLQQMLRAKYQGAKAVENSEENTALVDEKWIKVTPGEALASGSAAQSVEEMKTARLSAIQAVACKVGLKDKRSMEVIDAALSQTAPTELEYLQDQQRRQIDEQKQRKEADRPRCHS